MRLAIPAPHRQEANAQVEDVCQQEIAVANLNRNSLTNIAWRTRGPWPRCEFAQQMAAHESPRTTVRYYRRDNYVAVDEVERVLI
jgi:hypothetical protein